MRLSVLLLYGACALTALPAAAQSNAVASPWHSGARVPQTKYRSAFENYVPYREQPLAAWRDVNDEAGRVGGHAGVLRDADRADAKPETSSRDASASQEAAGQPPVRGAPKTPQSGHMGH